MLEVIGSNDRAMFGIGKNIKEGSFVRGKVTIRTIRDGKVIQETVVPFNQMLLVGDAHIADQLSDQGEAAMGWMSVGTTSGGKTEASTQLEAENTKNALSSGPTQGAGPDDHEIEYVGSFTGIAATLVEAAISNNAGANTGTYLCYTEFSHTVTAPDTLQITWTVSIGH